MVPAVGSIRRSASFATVDLPQPDSPTRHNVSPALIVKLTSSTARTAATVRARNPRLSAKCLVRFSTSSSGACVMPKLPLLLLLLPLPEGERVGVRGFLTPIARAAAPHPAALRPTSPRRGKVKRPVRAPPRGTRPRGRPPRHGAAATRCGNARPQTCSAQRRHDAGNFGEPPLARGAAKPRDRRHQAARIGVRRPIEQLEHRGFLDLAPGIHHDDARAGLGDDAEIVGDQDHGGAGAFLELEHQVEDLRLDGDIERGGRLVGDQ